MFVRNQGHTHRIVILAAAAWFAGAPGVFAQPPLFPPCADTSLLRRAEATPAPGVSPVAVASATITAGASSTEEATSQQVASSDEEDLSIDAVEPDFTVITLPTTLRLPLHKAAFRVTHRFARPLGQGTFGNLVEDFFGFDSGAQIGLEVRFAPVRGAQIGFYRTSDRTIQFFGQYSIVRQGPAPLALTVVAGVEGSNNFREHRVPTLGLVVSRKVGDRLALYASPLWIREFEDDAHAGGAPHDHAVENFFVAGAGARLRLASSTYLVGEIVPRLDSRAVLKHHVSFGLEKGVGGHAFQLNFSNGVGTTFAQVARGANNYDDWFVGFNISRKFY